MSSGTQRVIQGPTKPPSLLEENLQLKQEKAQILELVKQGVDEAERGAVIERKRFALIKTELESQVIAGDRKLLTLRQRCSDLESALRSLEKENHELRLHAKQNTAPMHLNQTALVEQPRAAHVGAESNLEQQVVALQAQLQNALRKEERLKAGNEVLVHTVEGLESKLKIAEAQCDVLEAGRDADQATLEKNKEFQARYKAMIQKWNSASKKLGTLTSHLKKREREVHSLRTSIADAEKISSDAVAEVQNAISEIETLKREKAAAISDAQRTLADKDAQIASLRNTIQMQAARLQRQVRPHIDMCDQGTQVDVLPSTPEVAEACCEAGPTVNETGSTAAESSAHVLSDQTRHGESRPRSFSGEKSFRHYPTLTDDDDAVAIGRKNAAMRVRKKLQQEKEERAKEAKSEKDIFKQRRQAERRRDAEFRRKLLGKKNSQRGRRKQPDNKASQSGTRSSASHEHVSAPENIPSNPPRPRPQLQKRDTNAHPQTLLRKKHADYQMRNRNQAAVEVPDKFDNNNSTLDPSLNMNEEQHRVDARRDVPGPAADHDPDLATQTVASKSRVEYLKRRREELIRMQQRLRQQQQQQMPLQTQ